MTVGKMQQELAATGLQIEAQDRFSVLGMWEKLSNEQRNIIGASNISTMGKEIAELAKLEACNGQVIHGDLGAWNMLDDGQRITVIDWGECREGDAYVDLAAAITSTVGAKNGRKEMAARAETFLMAYEQINGAVDKARLNGFVQLWLTRGILATALYRPEAEGALRAMEEQRRMWKEILR